MSNLFDLLAEGGLVMIPLAGLSVATIACGLDRGWFWYRLFRQEGRVVHDVLDAAKYDLDKAAMLAEQAKETAIGRFLLAPLRLRQPTPETFRLAMEAAGDKEFGLMRKGEKFLETVVALAPLLGLMGTVIGLIRTFGSLNVGGGGTADQATEAAAGIGEALICTASGMFVAIIALMLFRLFTTIQSQQMDFFAEVGNELELIYRQFWCEPGDAERDGSTPPAFPSMSAMGDQTR
jgi:biopolymer transport protein ExbB